MRRRRPFTNWVYMRLGVKVLIKIILERPCYMSIAIITDSGAVAHDTLVIWSCYNVLAYQYEMEKFQPVIYFKHDRHSPHHLDESCCISSTPSLHQINIAARNGNPIIHFFGVTSLPSNHWISIWSFNAIICMQMIE